MIVLPVWCNAGVIVATRFASGPANRPITILVPGTRVGLEEVAETTKLAEGVSRSAIAKATVLATSCGVLSSARNERVGGAFVALTVRRKLWLAEKPPSVTIKRMLA